MLSKLRGIRQSYVFYRKIGITPGKSFIYSCQKIFVHWVLFKKTRLLRMFCKYRDFNYSSGLWCTIHFGLSHARSILSKDKRTYLRGAEIEGLNDRSSNINYIHLEENDSFISILNQLKKSNITCIAIDGKFGKKDARISISGMYTLISTALIKAAFMLNKPVYFELIYFNSLMQIKRDFILLSKESYIDEISDFVKTYYMAYPYNIRSGSNRIQADD